MSEIIILPGIGGSGETHWQTHWERHYPHARRFQPENWDRPDRADWIAALDRAVAETEAPPLLVAHSLACLLVAHWQRVSARLVAGAFMVAVPDPGSHAFPLEAASFAGVPEEAFRFPSLMIASSDDPYGSLAYGRLRAAQWGSRIIEVGALGHINGKSGLGDWPAGRALFQSFAMEAVCPKAAPGE
ncbi:RBBP9/YdeN family alpha/beta hydrolase [Ensifer sp. MJa1]|uniref:RBBP9/YdeN family alpha/beta hydrolase n=1 Tax=Ensifer sp. MJa1 TaxID=2919888 RepID=UPI00300AB879